MFVLVIWQGIKAGLHVLVSKALNLVHTFVSTAVATFDGVGRGLSLPEW